MESKQEKLLNKRNAELEKQLAQTNRDLEVETSLERVRVVAMAMRNPDDMLEICRVITEQLGTLEVKEIRNVQTAVFNEARKTYINYEYYRLYDKSIISEAEYGNHPVHNAFAEKMLAGPGLFFMYAFEGDELEEWIAYQKKSGHFADPHLDDVTAVNYYWFSLGRIAWGITFYAPVSEAELEIVKRFRNVFDLAYRRFADIQMAEAQAREAQVQLSLERVRARTMAMQRSEELAETVFILFQQFKELDENPDQATIGIINEEEHVIEYWVTMYGSQINKVFKFSIDEPNVTHKIYKGWKAKKTSLVIDLSGKALLDFATYRQSKGGAKLNKGEKRRVINVAFFSKGLINVQSTEARSAESIQLLERFAGVFDGTYTRFLDLQKAEGQVREAQIETALEKVRSRSLAMHQTDELGEVVSVVFDKLHELGIVMAEEAASIVIFTEGTNDLILWNAIPDQLYSKSFNIPYYDTTVITSLFGAKKAGADFFEKNYTPAEKAHFWQWAVEHSDYKYIPDERKKHILAAEYFACSVAFTKNSAIMVSSYLGKLLSEKESEILKRFARVFEQAYVRFLDLQKAEAQGREAQIELSLERVRAKTMAMHTSEHVGETVATMFDELVKLGIEKTARCGISIIGDNQEMEVWRASYDPDGKVDMVIGRLDMTIHSLLQGVFKAWKNKEMAYAYELAGKDLKSYYREINNSPKFPAQFEIGSLPAKQFHNTLFFPEGAIFTLTLEPLSADAVKLFKRFAGVFGQTYRRYLDLQKAEEQAREAIKQASVDRVRGEIASMRSTGDLERITPLIWNELTILGIPFIRCGVFIVDEEEQLIHTHLSTSEGKALATFNLTFESDGIGQDVLPAWRNKQIATIHWSKEEFAAYTKNLVDQGTVKSKERYVTEHPDTSLDLHFFPFLQGMLYVGNIVPLTDNEKDLVQSLADAFSTAYARYEDFNKLETAKQQVENTLTDLKAAQTKLIQSEKMASLGELTAGIAHEIQNPLNFVNNFSEVNQEMIDELEEELRSGNIEEALAIAADIKQNEEKINHHGKRADGIVKGMLAHSRTGGGEKQPTNINALADEFLRLSYHGLRAKDKTFNAEMITHFDPNLPLINVIPQDIGRVMLNLFNNAFYAVNQKKKASGTGYKPEVSVSTSTENSHVIIKVKDNGIGMPEHIKEKIMQPFFTTKPTGEGTGLGLSLTYDMVVKGHGGKIDVNTKEGEYTEFTVWLPL